MMLVLAAVASGVADGAGVWGSCGGAGALNPAWVGPMAVVAVAMEPCGRWATTCGELDTSVTATVSVVA